MYVAQIMSTRLDTVTQTAKATQAAQIMREKGRRYLPVVDEQGKLVGLLSRAELARAEPSAITTLSVGEINYLTAKVTVDQLMVHKVVTCSPDTLVEEAGQLMRDRKVGCLPVVEEENLVGLVTQTDIFNFFLEITGCGLPDSARIAVHLKDEKGELGNLLDRINDFGGYIATVVSPLSPDETGKRIAIVRYRADNPSDLDRHLQELGYELVTERLP